MVFRSIRFLLSGISFCIFFLLPLYNQDPQYREDLTIVGPIVLEDGIGKQALDLVQSLYPTCKISFIETWTRVNKDSLPSFAQNIVDRSGVKYPGKVLIMEDYVGTFFGPQQESSYWKKYGLPEKDANQIRFAYTMFEASKVPDSYIHNLNHFYDAALVPDAAMVPMYKNSGVHIPIFVVPLGRDYEKFLTTELKQKANMPFIFANYGTCYPRKNTLLLVEAFGKAFGNTEKVQLHLGMRAWDESYAQKVKDMVRSLGLSNVYFTWNAVDENTYYNRFLQTDCYVSLSTGEGFSIQPREAMALGIPVIATDCFAQKTICDSGFVRTVKALFPIPAKFPFPGSFGIQLQCSLEDAVAALKDVYENYSSYLKMGPQARDWVRKYTLQNTAETYKKCIFPQEVILGQNDRITQVGLCTADTAFAKKYARIFHLRIKNEEGGAE